mmetsp:Transcript_19249/g.37081  ORF Transcript_19249/g.37081 Transcript_19249/m.37081 type:complete len:154 (+) Transcript_19249:101-562(+)
MHGSGRMATIYYWIPGDGDSVEHPNSFEVEAQGTGVRLREIRARFPLPGAYHFRFRFCWEGTYVWMDVTNEDSVVPLSDDMILSKVLRLNWVEVSKNPGLAPVSVKATKAPSAAAPPSEPAPQDMINFGELPGGQLGSKPQAAPSNDFDMLFG